MIKKAGTVSAYSFKLKKKFNKNELFENAFYEIQYSTIQDSRNLLRKIIVLFLQGTKWEVPR